MKVFVTGGGGLLAYALREAVRPDVQLLMLPRAEFDLLDREQMTQKLAEHRPKVVINTAAYNMVDKCEVERELSWGVNATGPAQLAELCAELGCRLVHYGSDYVFDGAKGKSYSEEDAPNPLNHYARGKLAGEEAVLKASSRNLVLRVSWLFGWHSTQAKSYVHTVVQQARAGRSLKATTDQSSVPTYVPDLARWTFELIKRDATGLVHAVNDGGVSRLEWTRIILEEASARLGIPEVAVEPVTTAYFNPTIRRPAYTVMSNAKLTGLLGRKAGSWRPGLVEMLGRMAAV